MSVKPENKQVYFRSSQIDQRSICSERSLLRSKNKELTNIDINKKLSKIKGYAGCFLKSEIQMKPSDICAVVNLESHPPGSHWVSFYIRSGILYYFDSFGIVPPNEIVEIAKNRKLEIVYQDSDLQKLSSKRCGYYCVYFIKEMAKNKSFFDVVFSFKQSPSEKNELLIS